MYHFLSERMKSCWKRQKTPSSYDSTGTLLVENIQNLPLDIVLHHIIPFLQDSTAITNLISTCKLFHSLAEEAFKSYLIRHIGEELDHSVPLRFNKSYRRFVKNLSGMKWYKHRKSHCHIRNEGLLATDRVNTTEAYKWVTNFTDIEVLDGERFYCEFCIRQLPDTSINRIKCAIGITAVGNRVGAETLWNCPYGFVSRNFKYPNSESIIYMGDGQIQCKSIKCGHNDYWCTGKNCLDCTITESVDPLHAGNRVGIYICNQQPEPYVIFLLNGEAKKKILFQTNENGSTLSVCPVASLINGATMEICHPPRYPFRKQDLVEQVTSNW